MEYINTDGFILHHETHSGDASLLLHYHPSFEIFITVSGSTTLLVDDKLLPVSEGEIVLLSPDIVHKNIGERLHSRYSVHFTKEYLSLHFSENLAALLTECFHNQKITLTDGAFESICVLLQRIKNNSLYTAVHAAEMIAILTDKSSRLAPKEKPRSSTAASILEYIKNNYAGITCLDDIADNVHISKQHLCRIFKKETGVTVSDYLNSIRISSACEMLRQGRRNITEIALLCGYNSAPYFCRMFKGIMRMTPKEYQKMSGRLKAW